MRLPLLASLLLCAPALAADPAPKPSAKTAPKKASKKASTSKIKAPSFSLPSLGEVPKAEGVTGPTAKDLGMRSRAAISDTYAVVKVQHAKAFAGQAGNAAPVEPLESVKLRGTPPVTDKFSSVVRVRSKQRRDAPIEVAILDARGDTALMAQGELAYGERDETEWVVEWAPTVLRAPGQYQVLIRIAGEPMGTWPLPILREP